MKSRARFVPFLVLLILALTSLVLAEASLQILARFVPTFERLLFPYTPGIIADAKLIRRGNPSFFDHDENGFRNPEIPARARIVAIGDSQTYGTSVSSTEAWPKVLERLSGCEVYSMSLGRYGPLQYAELARESAQLKPQLMVVGIYFGNDFFDNWEMYRSNPNKYPVPESLRRQAIQAESKSPLRATIIDFFNMGQPNEKIKPSLKALLASHSTLYGFLRAIKSQILVKKIDVLNPSFIKSVSALSPRQLEYASVFDGKIWRTIFTSRYRLAVEDSSDPRIMVGRWLTEWAIENIRNTAQSIGAKVIFVLLPTKEAVFSTKVNDAGNHPYFAQLVNNEALHKKHLMEFFAERDITYIDAGQVLGSLSEQPYFQNADGHPNSRGHEAIANAVRSEIRSCGPQDNVMQ